MTEIPAQERQSKWIKSHLLGYEIELQDLYELEQSELDLLMAETAEIRSDVENPVAMAAGARPVTFELARIIDQRRQQQD